MILDQKRSPADYVVPSSTSSVISFPQLHQWTHQVRQHAERSRVQRRMEAAPRKSRRSVHEAALQARPCVERKMSPRVLIAIWCVRSRDARVPDSLIQIDTIGGMSW